MVINNKELFDKAILNRSFGIVMHMIQNGFDIHYRNDYALRRAAESGDMTTVLFLIEFGADINARNSSALCWAAQNGHASIVKCLLDAGSEIPENIILYVIDSENVNILRIFRQLGIQICTKETLRYSLGSKLDVMRYILKYGSENDEKYLLGLIEKTEKLGGCNNKIHKDIIEWAHNKKRETWFSYVFSGLR